MKKIGTIKTIKIDGVFEEAKLIGYLKLDANKNQIKCPKCNDGFLYIHINSQKEKCTKCD